MDHDVTWYFLQHCADALRDARAVDDPTVVGLVPTAEAVANALELLIELQDDLFRAPRVRASGGGGLELAWGRGDYALLLVVTGGATSDDTHVEFLRDGRVVCRGYYDELEPSDLRGWLDAVQPDRENERT